jgi:hypothetical protein
MNGCDRQRIVSGDSVVTRLEGQQLAECWLVDAKRLLDDHRWSAAYYVAGYAVECGLKACILARMAAAPEVIFDDKKFSEKCWTHGIFELVKLAGQEAARAADSTANPALGRNWLVVNAWNEKACYLLNPARTTLPCMRSVLSH